MGDLHISMVTKDSCIIKEAKHNRKGAKYFMANLLLRCPGPEVIKLFSCSTQMSMKFFLLINVKMPTIVGIFIYEQEK